MHEWKAFDVNIYDKPFEGIVEDVFLSSTTEKINSDTESIEVKLLNNRTFDIYYHSEDFA